MHEYEWAKGSHKAQVRFYEGIGELIVDVKKAGLSNSGTAWNGHLDVAGAIAKAQRGATEKELRPVADLLDKIDAEARGREADAWMPSPVGAYPCIPEVLMGLPENMRRRIPVEDDRSPIRLFVEIIVSGGVEDATLAKRGAALAALALRMRELRPVELYVCWATRMYGALHDDVIGAVRVGTTPLSPGEIAFLCSDKSFCRQLAFCGMAAQAKTTNVNSISWAWHDTPGKAGRDDRVREAMRMNPQDIFLPGGHLSESALFATNPVKWVHGYLDAQREVE